MEAMHMNEAEKDIFQKRLPNKSIQYICNYAILLDRNTTLQQ